MALKAGDLIQRPRATLSENGMYGVKDPHVAYREKRGNYWCVNSSYYKEGLWLTPASLRINVCNRISYLF